jgi:hypothetical protein
MAMMLFFFLLLSSPSSGFLPAHFALFLRSEH